LVSAIYTDPRLAAVYEALNTSGFDDAFYLVLAGRTPKTILDMGCGTGRLACALALRGHSVTGAEPSAAMLEVARSRPGATDVRWINVAAATLALETRFALIIMTGHVFQVFLTVTEVSAALRALRRHLAPGGRLAFETRNPLARKWEQWTPADTLRSVDVPGIGAVEVHHTTRSVEGPLVTYDTHFRLPDGNLVIVSDTLRFEEQSEIARYLTDAGLAEITWYGDWDHSPFVPSSPEIIAVAAP
jgi:ubiquinone/menaquinone biosynthesis C-methylase UbiE